MRGLVPKVLTFTGRRRACAIRVYAPLADSIIVVELVGLRGTREFDRARAVKASFNQASTTILNAIYAP